MRPVDLTTLRRGLEKDRLQKVADGLAAAVVVSLPWSTSATGVLIPLWLVALLPTLDLSSIRREVATPAGGLPVALWAFAAIGMLWADASWGERLAGLSGSHKLLVIPLLLAQFRRSDRGWQVAACYLASVLVLLALSFATAMWPPLQLTFRPNTLPGVPVKDYISQSGAFVACAFVLLYLAGQAARQGRAALAAAAAMLALGLLADVAYVATGRTALVVIPALLALFGLRAANWKAGLALGAASLVLAGAAWSTSSYLRERVLAVQTEIGKHRSGELETSSGQRLEYWSKSIALIAEAPLVGHGTAKIKAIFTRSTLPSEPRSPPVGNPHNQLLTTAVQLGAIGAGLLIAMWGAHLLLFREGGLAAWAGLVIVVQNIVSSLFNSHLLDFTQGWTYVFGVGVMGGLVLRGALSPPGLAAPLR
jgi:hypothetical protein